MTKQDTDSDTNSPSTDENYQGEDDITLEEAQRTFAHGCVEEWDAAIQMYREILETIEHIDIHDEDDLRRAEMVIEHELEDAEMALRDAFDSIKNEL